MKFGPSNVASPLVLGSLTVLAAVCSVFSCSGPEESGTNTTVDATSPSTTPTNSATAEPSTPPSSTNEAPVIAPPANDGELIPETPDDAPPPMPSECASADAPTSLVPVVLAFVFDVSASMGSEFRECDSRVLKWDPVVAATKAFFSDPASAGISASLTFFPNEYAVLTDTLTNPMQGGGALPPGMPAFPAPTATPTDMPPAEVPPPVENVPGTNTPVRVCDDQEYTTPDVPLTELPSEVFATSIDSVTPPDEDTWRLSTPTLAALEGTIQYIEQLRATEPNASYSIVLVTDGTPGLCGGADDNVSVVAEAVAAVADNIPTYVIGVEDPESTDPQCPADALASLNEVAEMGGTESTFLIDTNDPAQTTVEFTNIINQIRESSFSCSLEIPEPPNGETFDKEQVNVTFSSEGSDLPYDYDPECLGTAGWRFDNEADPTVIELCPATCDTLLGSIGAAEGQLNVQFGCERRVTGAR